MKELIWFFVSVLITGLLSFYMVKLSKDHGFLESLTKPSWTPSLGLFTRIWIAMYIIIAYSGYKTYVSAATKEIRCTFLWIYFLQLALSLAWFVTFFGLKNPRASKSIILILILLVFIQIMYMYSLCPTASYLMFPYFIFLLLIAWWNFSVVDLNQL